MDQHAFLVNPVVFYFSKSSIRDTSTYFILIDLKKRTYEHIIRYKWHLTLMPFRF